MFTMRPLFLFLFCRNRLSSYLSGMKKNNIRNTVFVLLGSIFLALGIAGIFLPLLPTTPFLLLAASLYFKGSERMYNRLISHKRLGPYITNFREKKAIPLRAKIYSVSLLWATMLYCILCVVPFPVIKVLLVIVAVAVTWHILTFRTLR